MQMKEELKALQNRRKILATELGEPVSEDITLGVGSTAEASSSSAPVPSTGGEAAEQIEQLRAEYEAKHTAQEKAHGEALTNMKAAHEAALKEAQETIASQEVALQEAKEKADSAVAAATAASGSNTGGSDEVLEAQKAAHAQTISDLENKHEAALKQCQAMLEAKDQELKQECQRADAAEAEAKAAPASVPVTAAPAATADDDDDDDWGKELDD
jgi:hypothetical protein